MDSIIRTTKKLLPRRVFAALQPVYHYTLALLGAMRYDFPSKRLIVIGVTGTKGKTSTVELINSILEEAGHRTALAGTLRFKIADKEIPNKYKMTMPGRFFQQKFLRDAVRAGCTYAVMEMTSEGAKQFRHKFIDLDALVFTNLAPEHIESHGSYEKYLDAKLSIARTMAANSKKNTAIIANTSDPVGEKFLRTPRIRTQIGFSLHDAWPYQLTENGIDMTVSGMRIHSPLRGKFNIMNILAAVAVAKHFCIPLRAIHTGVERVKEIRGRMEKIEAGQPFGVFVDYAHTPDSLTAAYEALATATAGQGKKNLICVLGSTGGGRDTWKRPVMGGIAEKYCSRIILTNEDPYDEDPQKIIDEIRAGVKEKKVEVILDRREAIQRAIFSAKDERDAVIITGKGTDPYIMIANGGKIPWDDARVTKEELKNIS